MIHLVQIGILGRIGRFRAEDQRLRQRGCAVVCRTERGLEVGTVIKPLDGDSPFAQGPDGQELTDGQLLRRVTPDDRLILERIERFRDRAFEACSNLLRQRNLPAVLVDVEQLFDGKNLYFYFLGAITGELEALTEELAETWEAKVRFRQFARKLSEGCGPNCGTGESGCQTGSCTSCAVSKSCGARSATQATA